MSTKNNLIKAAMELFAKQGYFETSIDDISKMVGVKKASIYSHFTSKTDIYLKILDEQINLYLERVQNILQSSKGKDIQFILGETFKAIVEHYTDKNKLYFRKRAILLANNSLEPEMKKRVKHAIFEINSIFAELKSRIEADFVDINPKWIDICIFSYSIFINGYLELMLYEDLSQKDLERAWYNFWYGIQYKG